MFLILRSWPISSVAVALFISTACATPARAPISEICRVDVSSGAMVCSNPKGVIESIPMKDAGQFLCSKRTTFQMLIEDHLNCR